MKQQKQTEKKGLSKKAKILMGVLIPVGTIGIASAAILPFALKKQTPASENVIEMEQTSAESGEVKFANKSGMLLHANTVYTIKINYVQELLNKTCFSLGCGDGSTVGTDEIVSSAKLYINGNETVMTVEKSTKEYVAEISTGISQNDNIVIQATFCNEITLSIKELKVKVTND